MLTSFFWSFRFGKAHNHNNNLGDSASVGAKEASAYITVYIEESYSNEYVVALRVNRSVRKQKKERKKKKIRMGISEREGVS
jgi:hypothetical protein